MTYQIQQKNRRKAYPSRNALEARRTAENALLAIPLATHTQIAAQPQIYRPSVDVNELWRMYIAERDDGTRFWSDLRKRFNTINVPATKIGVMGLLNTKRDYPVAQRTLFEALRPFYRWCVSRDYLPKSPMDGLTPPRLPKSRDRILSAVEIKDLWAKTEAPWLFGPFFRLLLILGQRRNEIAYMTWAEIDLSSQVWTIPKERTKNGMAHRVHLPPLAIEILATRPKFIGKGISGFSKAKTQVGGTWRLHDLRRTFATGLASQGIAPHIIDKLLNHSTGGLRGVYQLYQYDQERKAAMATWDAYLRLLLL